jgi:hypothetical protein
MPVLAAAVLALTPMVSEEIAPADRSMAEVIDLLREEKTECVYDAASQVLTYIGGTEPDSVECFERHRDADVRTLRVSSFGGWAGSAIDGARIIQEEKWAVEAFGVCASSCMNYWAPAAASFNSTPGTVLIVHGRPPRRTTLVRLKRPRIVKLFVVPEDYRQHTDFAGSLNIPEDWFGSTRSAGGKIARGIGDPRSDALLVGPCHARLLADIVPVNVWWPSSQRELREFVDGLPTDVRLKECELDRLPE